MHAARRSTKKPDGICELPQDTGGFMLKDDWAPGAERHVHHGHQGVYDAPDDPSRSPRAQNPIGSPSAGVVERA